MQRILSSGIVAVLLGAGITLPLASQEITVTPGSRDAQAFVTEVSHALDRQLDRIYVSPRQSASGIAQIRFQIDAEGRPVNANLFRRSGDSVVDRVAMRAVQRLGDIGQLPAGYPDDQIVQANIILARSQSDLRQLQKRLHKIEAARVQQVARTNARPVLALTISVNSRF